MSRKDYRSLERWLKMHKPETEKQLHLKVAKYLNLVLDSDVLWTTHENSNQQGGRNGFVKQRILKAKGMKAGWPDIEIIWQDGTLHIELKSVKGSLSNDQEDIHAKLIAIGRSVSVCRSLEDINEALKQNNVPCRNINFLTDHSQCFF